MPTNKNATAQKERLTYQLVGQLFVIGVSVLALFFYIIPKWNTISEKTVKANESIKTYENTYKNGLTTQQILSLTAKDTKKQDLYSLIANNTKSVAEVIQKSGPEKQYIEWVNKELEQSEEDKEKLRIINAKMNSIVPTLSPVGSIVDEERVSLKNYITFIENNLLVANNITSESPVSIDKITYAEDPSTAEMGSIGFVDINLQFQGSNESIYNFLDYIYDLGNTELLTQTGVSLSSADQVPSIMSNPLVTVESLTLDNEINIDTDDTKATDNAGTIILRFYVRGSSESDAIFLSSEVESRKQELKNEIAELLSLCENAKIPCDEATENKLQAFDTKYDEFLRMAGVGTVGKNTSTSTITELGEQIHTLQEFKGEFTTLFQSLIDAKESLEISE